MRSLTATGLLIFIELGIAALMGIAFVALYALRSRWSSSAMGRHMMWFGIAQSLAYVTLFVALGWRIPFWVYPVVFLLVDMVFLQRLVLLWKAQKEEES